MLFFAMLLALAQSQPHLAIEPWTGSDFQTTSLTAAKYRLEVSGRPNDVIHLSAKNVASGWLAAFCTPRLCSPAASGRHVTVLGPRGVAVRAHSRIGRRPETQRRDHRGRQRRQRPRARSLSRIAPNCGRARRFRPRETSRSVRSSRAAAARQSGSAACSFQPGTA